MSFTTNSEHSNTRGFYTITHSTMAKHTFFCINDNCGRETPLYQTKCGACACPGCGETGATALGSDYCHTCLSVRDHPCNKAFVEYDDEDEFDIWCRADAVCRGCGIRIADGDEVCDGCRVQYSYDENASRCTCDDSGRMCEYCSEEYKEPCRGCGEYAHLWVDDRYCRGCYVKRYGCEFQKSVRVSDELKTELLADLPTEGDKWSFTPTGRRSSVASPPPLPPSPLEEPRTTQDILDQIDLITDKLDNTHMTEGQRADWERLLAVRKSEISDMRDGYDQDDLNKLDLQNRRGF